MQSEINIHQKAAKDMSVIHPRYLPFSREQMAQHFTGEVEGNVGYFQRSADRYREFSQKFPSPLQPLSRSRQDRQMEKDERFWTAASLKAVFERDDRVSCFGEILRRTFGARPPLDAFDTWEGID